MYSINNNILNGETKFEEAFLSLNSLEAKSIIVKELKKRILYQHYFEELQINMAKTDICSEMLIQNFCVKYKLRSVEEFEKFLAGLKVTREEFLEKLVYEEKINCLKNLIIKDQDIKDLFIEKKVKQEAVLFGILEVNEKSAANELFYRLTHDLQDFGELARLYSTGEKPGQNWIIGPISLQSINTEIRSRLAIMDEGQISKPFTIDRKIFLMVKLLRIDRLSLNSQIKVRLRDELFDQWSEKQLNLIDLKL